MAFLGEPWSWGHLRNLGSKKTWRRPLGGWALDKGCPRIGTQWDWDRTQVPFPGSRKQKGKTGCPEQAGKGQAEVPF